MGPIRAPPNPQSAHRPVPESDHRCVAHNTCTSTTRARPATIGVRLVVPDRVYPPPAPGLDCGDIVHRNFTVIGADPYRFDGDDDGIGCRS